MRTHRLALESIVLTADGPRRGDRLMRGDRPFVVTATGEIVATPVEEVGDVREGNLVRVLSRRGEALVPLGSQLAGSSGMIDAADLSDDPHQRLEFLAPSDLPGLAEKPCDPLDGLAPGRFMLPSRDDGTQPVLDAVARELGALGVQHEIAEADRWLMVHVQDSPGPQDNWCWGDELRLIRLLCSWETDEGDVVITRARMGQTALRHRLLSSHIAAGPPFSISWLPGYHPVECRIAADARSIPAFDQAAWVTRERGGQRDITTEIEGSLIVGPAIVRTKP